MYIYWVLRVDHAARRLVRTTVHFDPRVRS